MNSQDQFDDLLRSKFETNTVEFNELHWKQAEQLIIANEKKEKNRKFVVWTFTGVLLLTGLVVWYAIQEKQNSNPENKTEKNPDSKTQQPFSSDKSRVLFENKKPIEKENTKNTANLNTGARRNSDKKADVENINIPTNHTTQAELSLISSTTKIKLNRIINKSRIDLNNETESPAPGNTINTISKNYLQQPDNTISEINPQSEVTLNQIQNESNPVFEENTTNLPIKDSLIEAFEPVLKPAIKAKQIYPLISCNILAGTYFSKAFHSGNDYAINLSLGFSGIYQLNKTWGLEMNSIYFEKGKINSTKNFHSEYYSGEFGKRTNDISIHAARLQYLSFPLLINYHFNANHQAIEAGMSYNYLLNSYSKIEYNSQATGSTVNSSTENKYGYTNGFQKYDIAVILGYTQHLIKNLQAGIRLHYGLKDITMNSYYKNSSKDKNVGINLFIKYKLY